jgi:DNA-binding NtrC family response regulator
MERIAALISKEWIEPRDFCPEIQNAVRENKAHPEKTIGTLKNIEKKIIQKRLLKNGGNVQRTAISLGLTRHGLYSKMKILGIPKTTPRPKSQARSPQGIRLSKKRA